MARAAVGARPLPPFFIYAGSALILVHLAALGILVLSAPSGPWPTNYGQDMAVAPQFALAAGSVTNEYYLRPLGLAYSNYHFATNRARIPAVLFEVVLRDEQNKEIQRFRFPDDNANFWVHHRQTLLTRWLADDQPIPQRGAEVVSVKGQQPPRLSYLLTLEEIRRARAQDIQMETPPLEDKVDLPDSKVRHMYLVWVRDDQAGAIPRDRPVFRPSDMSLLLAKAYMRDLQRKYKAHAVDLVRYYRDAVSPEFLYIPDANALPRDSFLEIVTHFGDLQGNSEEGSR
jgi:hypothetical protein